MVRAIIVFYNILQEEKINSKETPKPTVPTVAKATQPTQPHLTTLHIELRPNKRVREKREILWGTPKHERGVHAVPKSGTKSPEGETYIAKVRMAITSGGSAEIVEVLQLSHICEPRENIH